MGIERISQNLGTIKNIEKKPNYKGRLKKLVNPILKEIEHPLKKGKLAFSKPIDPAMASYQGASIYACPLFVIALDEIPLEIRPTDWKDPRLCDLNFLQRLSDWIAETCQIPKQQVSFAEAAAAKAIIKLKQDPEGIKAIKAGIVHELAHVILRHGFNDTKTNKQKEKEADLYVVEHLKEGLEGIKIGFHAWQESLKDVRSNQAFDWKNRILTSLLITPGGNLIPLYFTHGFFETRIKQAEEAYKKFL